MLRFSKAQGQVPLLFDRQALIEDLEDYVGERLPSAMAALPRGLRWAMLNETIRIALWFRLHDVDHLRFFAFLRWDIAPGFYREPRLWRVLAAVEQDETARMDMLASDAMEDAWQAAIAGADPAHWQDSPETLAR